MANTRNRNAMPRTAADARQNRRAAFLATIRAAADGHRAPVSRASRATVEVERPPQRQTKPQQRPAPEKPQPQAQPRAGLFREEALRHRYSFDEGRGLVHVSPPWTWAVVGVVAVALGVAAAVSVVGRVDVTSRGRGILRPATGVRALTTQLTGTVVAIHAQSGQAVKAGTTLVRVESPAMQAQLLEADRELDAVKNDYSAFALRQDQHYASQVEQLKARAARIEEQIASLRASEVHHQQRLQADQQLLAKGLVSEMAVGEWREALAQAQRQLSGAQQTLDQTRQELASLESRRQDELWQRRQLVTAAQNKRDSLALVMRQSVIQAPDDGTVDGLFSKVGETVQAGQVVGKLIPANAPLRVVSFLPEKDRAFVKPGDEVRLELDQLPHAEFGSLRGRIARIGDDLASAPEIQEALGDAQKLAAPSYRVEIEITDAAAADAARVKLRTGGLMNVRFTLRHQRLITIVFKPLGRWFK